MWGMQEEVGRAERGWDLHGFFGEYGTLGSPVGTPSPKLKWGHAIGMPLSLVRKKVDCIHHM